MGSLADAVPAEGFWAYVRRHGLIVTLLSLLILLVVAISIRPWNGADEIKAAMGKRLEEVSLNLTQTQQELLSTQKALQDAQLALKQSQEAILVLQSGGAGTTPSPAVTEEQVDFFPGAVLLEQTRSQRSSESAATRSSAEQMQAGSDSQNRPAEASAAAESENPAGDRLGATSDSENMGHGVSPKSPEWPSRASSEETKTETTVHRGARDDARSRQLENARHAVESLSTAVTALQQNQREFVSTSKGLAEVRRAVAFARHDVDVAEGRQAQHPSDAIDDYLDPRVNTLAELLEGDSSHERRLSQQYVESLSSADSLSDSEVGKLSTEATQMLSRVNRLIVEFQRGIRQAQEQLTKEQAVLLDLQKQLSR